MPTGDTDYGALPKSSSPRATSSRAQRRIALADGRVVTLYYAVGSKTHPDWGVHCGVAEFKPPAK